MIWRVAHVDAGRRSKRAKLWRRARSLMATGLRGKKRFSLLVLLLLICLLMMNWLHALSTASTCSVTRSQLYPVLLSMLGDPASVALNPKPPLRTPRAPRVPPSPTANSKTSGAGAGDQLRLQQYEVSRSTPVQDARIPSEGNLRSTKVLRKVGGATKVPPASPRRGWRHFRPRLTSYAYVHDGYYRALRRQLYVTTCI